jgi:carbon monoxide dehydrogenase subunit G
MELTGEEKIAQSIDKVWEALNDPLILKECIPGCEDIAKTGDNEYKIVLLAAVGPVKARFSGKLQLADLNPPSSYSLTFEGAGGAAGFTKGAAQVSLASEGAFTRLTYRTEAKIGGKIAQVGARLIDGVAAKTAADFFARFNRIVAPVPVSSTATATVGAEAEAEAVMAGPSADANWATAGAPYMPDQSKQPGRPVAASASAPAGQRKNSLLSFSWWVILLIAVVAIGFYVLR